MGYKDYRSGGGRFGNDMLGGVGVEFEMFRNMAHGAWIEKSTTGSSQITGTGNGTYLYNIASGIVVVGGKVYEVAKAVNQACEAPANVMASGYSKVYMFVAYKKPDNTVAIMIVKGTAALTAAVVPPTVAEIVAAVPVGLPWIVLGTMTIARTADTTVTEAVDNKYRPLGLPKTVHED